MKEHIFDNQGQLFRALSAVLIALAHEVAADPHAVMALAGGSTPKPLYQAIADQFDWSKIWLLPTDERQVPEADPSSNLLMLKENLGLVGAPQKLISLTKSPEVFFKERSLFLHTILLGMGEDGHIASLFPPFTPTEGGMFTKGRAPNPPYERISLNFNEIIKAKHIILLFTGKAKQEIYEKAKQGVTEDLPVSHLLEKCKGRLQVYCAVQPPSIL